MTTYLFQFAIGPVQGFINTARRTRDLWAGSYLLSDLVLEVLNQVSEKKGKLIYPTCTQHKAQKELRDQMVGMSDVEFVGNLSNQVLAQITLDTCPKECAKAIKEALVKRLQDLFKAATDAMPIKKTKLRTDLFEKQLNDAMEFYAVWIEWDSQASSYKAQLSQLKAAMAARKATRDFAVFPGAAGVPKSSLDGFAESVLPEPRKPQQGGANLPTLVRTTAFNRYLGLKNSEQLDALGVLKRHIGTNEHFTALPRLAADGWIESVCAKEPELWGEMVKKYGEVWKVTRKEYNHLGPTSTCGNQGIYSNLPFDADLLYPTRLEAAKKEAKGDPAKGVEANQDLLKVLGDFEKSFAIQTLWQRYGNPSPYAGVLLADGDRMGEFLDRITSQKQHCAVTEAIAGFASQVPAILRTNERNNLEGNTETGRKSIRGHAVYAGGEDVMALLPLSGVLEAAQQLNAAFNEAMQGLGNLNLGMPPTLRVGIAICHVMDPYSLLRSRAQDAEQLAKLGQNKTKLKDDKTGNALGLILYPRSGAEVSLRLSFDAGQGDFNAMNDWMVHYKTGALNSRIAFDVLDAAQRLQAQFIRHEVAQADVKRTIARSMERGHSSKELSKQVVAQVEARLEALKLINSDPYAVLHQLGSELVLARWLTAAAQNDLGERV